MRASSQAGFGCFTDDAAFRRYMTTEVLAEIAHA
jgi:hypothetical protein